MSMSTLSRHVFFRAGACCSNGKWSCSRFATDLLQQIQKCCSADFDGASCSETEQVPTWVVMGIFRLLLTLTDQTIFPSYQKWLKLFQWKLPKLLRDRAVSKIRLGFSSLFSDLEQNWLAPFLLLENAIRTTSYSLIEHAHFMYHPLRPEEK